MSNIIELNQNSSATGIEIAIIGSATVANILETVKNLPVIKEEDMNFLKENSPHLGKVMECTYIWRTDLQKVSIINDVDFPTTHSKFHQAILEQKVQFDNAMYLAKDYEDLKLDLEMIQLEIEELKADNEKYIADGKENSIQYRKNEIQINKKTLDIQFKAYNLEQMRIAMDYRMKEVKGWQKIELELMGDLRRQGMKDEEIWEKSHEEIKAAFFMFMTKLQAIAGANNLSSAEYNNIIASAVHAYTQAVNAGRLEEFKRECNPTQLGSINFIENYLDQRNRRI